MNDGYRATIKTESGLSSEKLTAIKLAACNAIENHVLDQMLSTISVEGHGFDLDITGDDRLEIMWDGVNWVEIDPYQIESIGEPLFEQFPDVNFEITFVDFKSAEEHQDDFAETIFRGPDSDELTRKHRAQRVIDTLQLAVEGMDSLNYNLSISVIRWVMQAIRREEGLNG